MRIKIFLLLGRRIISTKVAMQVARSNRYYCQVQIAKGY